MYATVTVFPAVSDATVSSTTLLSPVLRAAADTALFASDMSTVKSPYASVVLSSSSLNATLIFVLEVVTAEAKNGAA